MYRVNIVLVILEIQSVFKTLKHFSQDLNDPWPIGAPVFFKLFTVYRPQHHRKIQGPQGPHPGCSDLRPSATNKWHMCTMFLRFLVMVLLSDFFLLKTNLEYWIIFTVCVHMCSMSTRLSGQKTPGWCMGRLEELPRIPPRKISGKLKSSWSIIIFPTKWHEYDWIWLIEWL